MKKLKANSILATFVFGVSILMLCSFGTDAAYVILSRYKLQKITEAVAIEYATTKARDYDYTPNQAAENLARDKMIKKYESIYNVIGSGVLVFDINKLEYKSNRPNKETVVKVETTSKVLPVFLRFVGVREIILHSNAYAKTNRITLEETIQSDADFGSGSKGFVFGRYANSQETKVNFDAPFLEKSGIKVTKAADLITSRGTGLGDFMIEFEYQNGTTDLGTGGGFFVLAGYDTKDATGGDTISWVDVGNKAINKSSSELKRICVNPEGSDGSGGWAQFEETTEYNLDVQCYYCINAAKEKAIVFDLSKDIAGTKDTGGRINKISHFKIYKAGGSAQQKTGTNEIENPCDPTFTQIQLASAAAKIPYAAAGRFSYTIDDWSKPYVNLGGGKQYYIPSYQYFNRNAVVRLTILNNVSLIRASEYKSFSTQEAQGGSDADIQGSYQKRETM